MTNIAPFLIGTGYHQRDVIADTHFSFIWQENLSRYCPQADRVAVITTGAHFPTYPGRKFMVDQIHGENLGHLGDLIHAPPASEAILDATMPVRLAPRCCGWSASVLALCLIAYNCNRDLVYLEQDCLAFGHWLGQAYLDLGHHDMIFGQKHDREPWMPCSQSLFIIRHRFLLEFVRRYLSLPPDREMNPENKFVELETLDPAKYARLSFGVDRCRPIPWDAPVWYAQRFTEDELAEAHRRELLTLNS